MANRRRSPAEPRHVFVHHAFREVTKMHLWDALALCAAAHLGEGATPHDVMQAMETWSRKAQELRNWAYGPGEQRIDFVGAAERFAAMVEGVSSGIAQETRDEINAFGGGT